MRPLISIVLLLVPVLSMSSTVYAALIIVPDDAPTIQFAILAASNGDSILVRAGTYAESLALTGKDLTIFGESGAQATAITGNSSFRIFEVTGPNVTMATVLEGLTFRNGRAPQGAGIRLSSGASLGFRRCRFLQNAALGIGPNLVAGGAVFVGESSTLIAEECLFQDNQAAYTDLGGEGSGGAIECRPGSQIEVRDSDFIHNSTSGFEGGFGSGIDVRGSALVENCLFSDGFGQEGVGIRVTKSLGGPDATLVVRRCVFNGNVATIFGAAGIQCGNAMITLENNTFFMNSGEAVLASSSTRGTIMHNTIAFNGNGMKLQGLSQGQLVVSNNIVSNDYGVGVTVSGTPAPGSLACNDVWASQGGNYSGIPDPTGTNGNISADPLFCNAPARDFTLNGSSPCMPQNSPAGCGLIGAWPVGCGVTDVADEAPTVSLKLTVFPNPVRGTALFELDAIAPATTLNIFDSQGRLVQQLHRQDDHWSWTPGSRVPTGVYFARPGETGEGEAVKFLYVR